MTDRPKLILTQGGLFSRPIEMEKNLDHLRSLPIDGMVVNTPETFGAMRPGYVVDEASLRGWLERIADFNAEMGDNYMSIFTDRPGDLFDDAAWAQVAENFATIAKVAKETNFKGLLYDNEEYGLEWQNFPEDYPDADPSEREAYIAMAIQRGREVMEAIRSEFPEADVMTNHGPFESVPVSENSSDIIALRQPSSSQAFELRGPFFTGMLEAAGPDQRMVDNGQLYRLRTDGDFADSLEYRRDFLPGEIPWPIPDALRAAWDERVVQTHTVISGPSFEGFDMTPEIFEDTLVNAFNHSEEMVLLYSDHPINNWSKPGDVSQAWRDALDNAIARSDAIFAGNPEPIPDPGPDWTAGTNDADMMLGLQKSEEIRALGGDDTVRGRDGADTLRGGAGEDELVGGEGDDHLFGNAGNDSIFGSEGQDRLWGGDGADVLGGDDGDDVLRGGLGADRLLGAAGDDTLHGGAGADTLSGSLGDDQLRGGSGDDDLSGGEGADVMRGQADDDRLWGHEGADTMFGDGGDDALQGNDGDDRLLGGAGGDRLQGGDGADVLIGGGGADTLTGDAGADVFVFRAGDGLDWVSDFQDGQDKIRLAGMSLDAVQIVQDNSKAVITFQGGEVVLFGTQAAALDAEDFLF